MTVTTSKTALVTGISGQDGAYLAKLLLNKGYRVVGGVRRSSVKVLPRLEELGIANAVELVDFDLFEYSNLLRTLEKVKPDEIYNLAAQSFVGVSFEQPLYTAEIDAVGVMRLLEALRAYNPAVRMYQASTSEMFGKVQTVPQTEMTPFYPRSPYAVAKLFAHWAVVNYRESYGMHVSSGILFNHESPLRGIEFVTRKITAGLARLKRGDGEAVRLGNLSAQRDWGYAEEYVEGMWQMLQQPEADDYVLATGTTTTVRSFAESAAAALEMELVWEGAGENERGIDRRSGKTAINVDPSFFRPAEVDLLLGDPSKAKSSLRWAAKTPMSELAQMMALADDKRVCAGVLRF